MIHALSSKRGDRTTYIGGLKGLLDICEEHPECRTILHSDQGAVYASKAFNELLPMYGVMHSNRRGPLSDSVSFLLISIFCVQFLLTNAIDREKPCTDMQMKTLNKVSCEGINVAYICSDFSWERDLLV